MDMQMKQPWDNLNEEEEVSSEFPLEMKRSWNLRAKLN